MVRSISEGKRWMVKRNQETTTTKLKRISERSKNHPEATFKWLVQHFNKSSLLKCYQELDARKAIGVDGMTKDRYGKKLSENLEVLLKRMKQMSYKPGPIREVEIPKEGACKLNCVNAH